MKPNPMLDEKMRAQGYVSVPEASDRTGISRTTLYDALSREYIAGTSVGSRKYLEVESLLEYVGDGGRELFESTAP